MKKRIEQWLVKCLKNSKDGALSPANIHEPDKTIHLGTFAFITLEFMTPKERFFCALLCRYHGWQMMETKIVFTHTFLGKKFEVEF